MTAKTKALLVNIFFHFVVLGVVVRLSFFSDMPGEYWLGLIGMVFLTRPIVAYFYGWDMTFRNTIAADAPKYQRRIAFAISVIVYIVALFIWLGVIGHLN